ncbi:MAG: hypothetical protein MJ116_04385 [Lachnospiraceae bacterium]|nr:hypothetical protein [Lachnospiraceae bacterium]
MIVIDNEKTEIFGWEAAIRGMRNPKNSWDQMDSDFGPMVPELGPKDLHLAEVLAKAGTDHGKYLRMITVYTDVTAPLYWWKEYDTYKVGTVADSCSTMHKIQSKEFVREDFSFEHLTERNLQMLDRIIEVLNDSRDAFNRNLQKDDWWQMIQMLPSSFNQKRTILLNYAVLKNMYHSRKAHKLDEWRIFCQWIETLPYSQLIIE